MQFRKSFLVTLVWLAVLCAFGPDVRSQSSDQGLPTAVLSNEINGRIPARDLGDPRLTRHFYAFEGTPGDLLITLDSKNLNGDIDVFTSVTFRPLMKTTMYANTQSPEVTKGIYLRARQILILRIEARTPSDDDGSYHIRFGGSFSPFSGGIPVAENTEPSSDTAPPSRGTKRLSSVGATIAEPVTEKPATVEPQPTTENATEKPAAETEAAKKTTTAKSTRAKPTRTTTARKTSGRRSRPVPSKPTPDKKPSDDTATKTGSEPAKKENPGEEKSAATSEKPATAEKPQETVAPQPGARLIIEEKDGTKIERPMSIVRRVVVEGNIIVIVLKTGKIERVPMSIVARMAIEP